MNLKSYSFWYSFHYAHFWRDHVFRCILYDETVEVSLYNYFKYKEIFNNLKIKVKISLLGNKKKWEKYMEKRGGGLLDKCQRKASLYPLIKNKSIVNYEKYKICYITRGNNKRRSINNKSELFQTLQKYNVTILDTSKIPPLTQMKIFANCKMVISLHGAAFANILYMPGNSYVFEIFPKTHYKQTYQNLAKICSLNHKSLFLETSIIKKSQKCIKFPRDCEITISKEDIEMIENELKKVIVNI